MRRLVLPLFWLLVLGLGPVLAQQGSSIRPPPRPAALVDPASEAEPALTAGAGGRAQPSVRVIAPVAALGRGPLRSVRPLRRPVAQDRAVVLPPPEPARIEAPIMAMAEPSLRPKPRTGLLGKIFGSGAKVPNVVNRSVKGSVCGDPAIRGEKIAPIPGKINGCGVADPVRVTEVDGVRLSVAATVDCDTARALRKWVSTGLKPAFGAQGVSELRVAAHYACRSRNNRPGARISEHGRGKAIDIAGFKLANGAEVNVLRNYQGSIKRAYRAACGTFGTTLGPGSDGYHQDHMHFDTARHRSGPYCR